MLCDESAKHCAARTGSSAEKVELQTVSFFTTISDMWPSRTFESYTNLFTFYTKSGNFKANGSKQLTFLKTIKAYKVVLNYKVNFIVTEALASWGMSEDRQVCESRSNTVKATSLNKQTLLRCFMAPTTLSYC